MWSIIPLKYSFLQQTFSIPRYKTYFDTTNTAFIAGVKWALRSDRLLPYPGHGWLPQPNQAVQWPGWTPKRTSRRPKAQRQTGTYPAAAQRWLGHRIAKVNPRPERAVQPKPAQVFSVERQPLRHPGGKQPREITSAQPSPGDAGQDVGGGGGLAAGRRGARCKRSCHIGKREGTTYDAARGGDWDFKNTLKVHIFEGGVPRLLVAMMELLQLLSCANCGEVQREPVTKTAGKC